MAIWLCFTEEAENGRESKIEKFFVDNYNFVSIIKLKYNFKLQSSFDWNNNFNTKKYKAIQDDVLALISGKTLTQTDSWGSGK
jgi:hypothetical protein